MKTVSSSSSVSGGRPGQVVQAEARASASSDGESFVFTHSSASIGERPEAGEGPGAPVQGEAGGGEVVLLPDPLPPATEPGAILIPAAEEPVADAAPHAVPPLGLADSFFGFG
ncbi:hypothetical protein BKE38_19660 [Pseudoroseomonas deserti]|uniref:Uncharacterized protein n=1 Tax=Teichococcus deserti TaxID=1817963 RepID=A0A1V2GYW5_9PROT|nr:hypothetical protein [Pseudoroseomonas deserti]ONG50057.1 hypothetical protein BKE38_19660 [Pseudoroseomonas deserti]